MISKHALMLSLSAVILVACGNDDDNDDNDGKPMPAAQISCPANPGACNQAEVNQYGLCIADRCDAAYQTCFGPSYRSGTFGGVCGTYYGCVAHCPCNDSACRSRCGIAPLDCLTCIAAQVATCANNSGCARPACVGPAPNGNETCADLLRCCNSLSDEDQRSFCLTEYAEARGQGDFICAPFVQGYRRSGMCR
jgi:hypothetical protein